MLIEVKSKQEQWRKGPILTVDRVAAETTSWLQFRGEVKGIRDGGAGVFQVEIEPAGKPWKIAEEEKEKQILCWLAFKYRACTILTVRGNTINAGGNKLAQLLREAYV